MIQNARMIMKRGNGVPTVPVSNDNNDGTWIATDIYEGEQYMDLDTGIVYTRYGNDIQTVQTGLADERVIIGNTSQSSTSAPTLVIGKNNTGAVLSTARDAIGDYRIISDLPIFLSGACFPIITTPQSNLSWGARIYRVSDTEIGLASDDGNALSDDILDETAFIIYLF
jgi:hypothetical protein